MDGKTIILLILLIGSIIRLIIDCLMWDKREVELDAVRDLLKAIIEMDSRVCEINNEICDSAKKANSEWSNMCRNMNQEWSNAMQKFADEIDSCDWYHINEQGQLVHGSNDEYESLYKAKDILAILRKYVGDMD